LITRAGADNVGIVGNSISDGGAGGLTVIGSYTVVSGNVLYLTGMQIDGDNVAVSGNTLSAAGTEDIVVGATANYVTIMGNAHGGHDIVGSAGANVIVMGNVNSFSVSGDVVTATDNGGDYNLNN